MCGITGILQSQGLTEAELVAQATGMAMAVQHRGPDDSGVWADAQRGIALGFRRLSIIDLSAAGHQPMRSASGRFVIIFNGEVFNFRALRGELERSGARFLGHSDTEVILAGFEAWGVEAAVRRFVGMFAMAVWDAEKQSLTLIRDRLGIKPLFIHHRPGLLTFGSELKALLAGPAFDRSLDVEAATQFLRYLYVPAPRTLFKAVRKLMPGHLLEIRDPAAPLPASHAYWSVDDAVRRGMEAPVEAAEDEVVAEFRTLLTESIRLRLESDVPLGALLSGGLDSSTVVAVMQSLSSRPVQTFTIGFEGGEHDESTHARNVASHLRTDHTELHLSGKGALDAVAMLPDMLDEPIADPSIIPTFLVSRLARQHVTVALTGDGGDELLGGYNRYVNGPGVIGRAGRVPSGIRRAAGASLTALSPEAWDQVHQLVRPILPKSARVRLAGTKLHKLGALLQEDSEPARYRSLISFWQHPERVIHGAVEADDPVLAGYTRLRALESLERMMAVDQQVYLPDDLLAKVDRASMAVSLEARVPLLDHRMVEWTWRLPRQFKIRNGQSKWILRQVLYDLVPRELVDRPKVGFTVPIRAWLRGPLAEWAGELLTASNGELCPLLDAEATRDSWNRFHRHGRGEANAIWALTLLQAWHRRWNR